jgi:fumarylpyruvate hydrolase
MAYRFSVVRACGISGYIVPLLEALDVKTSAQNYPRSASFGGLKYALEPPSVVSLPISETTLRFPVHRIFCIGRNYADHAREMGHNPDREPPFFFLKPTSAVQGPTENFRYPSASRDVHHEVELVVALGAGGRDISLTDAASCIFGYAVGLDMTRRDLQAEAKKLQRPWETGKAFDGSAPISAIRRADKVGDMSKRRISLTVNGTVRQMGSTADMIWSVQEIISYISRYFELTAGDLIMTGTPAGVGAVNIGDRLAADIEGLEPLRIEVTA